MVARGGLPVSAFLWASPLTALVLVSCLDEPDDLFEDVFDETWGTECGNRNVGEASELTTRLVSLGYGEYEFAEGDGDGDSIVTEQADWDALVGELEAGEDLAPDFSTEAVWVHRWTDGGCEAAFEYRAWQWEDGAVRMGRLQPWDDHCEAAFPAVDLVAAPVEDAADLGWCEK